MPYGPRDYYGKIKSACYRPIEYGLSDKCSMTHRVERGRQV